MLLRIFFNKGAKKRLMPAEKTVCFGIILGLFGFVLSEAEIAVFFIIPCSKEVCIGFCRFENWVRFFGARMGSLFS